MTPRFEGVSGFLCSRRGLWDLSRRYCMDDAIAVVARKVKISIPANFQINATA